MTPDNKEMPGLIRHIMFDAVARDLNQFELIVFCSGLLVLGWDATVARSHSFPYFIVLMASAILPFSVSFFRADSRFLVCMPVSQTFRGRYVWVSSLIGPLLGLFPLLAVAAWNAYSTPYFASVPWTLLVSYPVVFSLLANMPGAVTVSRGALPLLLGLLVSIQYVNYLLYWRLDFPWLFLLLTPFAVASLLRSYRRTHLMGRVGPGPQPDRPAPEKATRDIDPRLDFVFTTALAPVFVGVAALLSYLAMYLVLGGVASFNAAALFIASPLPPLIGFGQASAQLHTRLCLLRSLPLSRTRFAGYVLAGGVVATFLQVGLIALIVGLQRLPNLPLNGVLLWMCSAAFLPGLVVYCGRRHLKLLIALVVLVPIVVGRCIVFWKLADTTTGLIPSPLMALAATACLLGAFFLLRHALLHSRFDEGYAQEVQQMYAGRGEA